MSFTLLELTLRGVDMDFLAFLDGFKGLIMCGGNDFIHVI